MIIRVIRGASPARSTGAQAERAAHPIQVSPQSAETGGQASVARQGSLHPRRQSIMTMPSDKVFCQTRMVRPDHGPMWTHHWGVNFGGVSCRPSSSLPAGASSVVRTALSQLPISIHFEIGGRSSDIAAAVAPDVGISGVDYADRWYSPEGLPSVGTVDPWAAAWR